MKKIALSCLIAAATLGCMKQQISPATNAAADTATEGVGCDQKFQSKVFDSMYEYLDQQQSTPDLVQLKSAVSDKIDQIALAQDIQDQETLEKYKTEFGKVFEIMLNDAKSSEVKKHVQTLIEMEMQDQSSSANIELNNKLSTQFSKVNQLGAELNLQCNNSNSESTPPRSVNTPTVHRMVAGMSNVVTTAYQSCKVLDVPPMTGNTPDVEGILRFADHADGIGGKRRVTDLAAVQRTHPYIAVSGNKTSAGCYNVYNNPLIYDYGGAPYIESDSSLNMFKNSGSGQPVLGIDCSALVASAAAVGGLRYRPGVENKAIFVRYASNKFIDAAASGFTCYQNITLTKSESLKAGDIAAVRGHVNMVDSVGADPFGLRKVPNLAGCSNIDPRNFDFVITQSSAVKNGIGIDRYQGGEYIARGENPHMVDLFMSMAKSACEAYFKNTSIKPKNADYGIIRHKGTAECIAPTKVKLVNQSCVSSCQM